MKRISIAPKFEHEYWLGYIFNGERSGLGTSSVHGVYWGFHKGKHVFVGLTGDKVAVYSTHDKNCDLVWFSDGEDDPSISAPDVHFAQFMPTGRLENLAKEIIQIAKEEDKKKQENYWQNIQKKSA